MPFLLEKWSFVLDNCPRFFILHSLKGGLTSSFATEWGEERKKKSLGFDGYYVYDVSSPLLWEGLV